MMGMMRGKGRGSERRTSRGVKKEEQNEGDAREGKKGQ